MSSRRAKERRTNLIVGVFVLALGSLGTASLFTIAVSEGWGVSKERITAHFRTVSGLTHNSKVQLAGKEIGKVVGLDFISARYECNPATEDNGAVGVRTDDCDPFLFCSEEGFCANLEAFTGNEEDYRDQSCVGDTSCAEGSVCVTAPFRGRYRRVDGKVVMGGVFATTAITRGLKSRWRSMVTSSTSSARTVGPRCSPTVCSGTS